MYKHEATIAGRVLTKQLQTDQTVLLSLLLPRIGPQMPIVKAGAGSPVLERTSDQAEVEGWRHT